MSALSLQGGSVGKPTSTKPGKVSADHDDEKKVDTEKDDAKALKQKTVLDDNFTGQSLNPLYWNSLPMIPGYGDPAIANGIARFETCQAANTSGKVSVSGSKIIMESRFAGPKAWGRDSGRLHHPPHQFRATGAGGGAVRAG
jgi:hypothetical protein